MKIKTLSLVKLTFLVFSINAMAGMFDAETGIAISSQKFSNALYKKLTGHTPVGGDDVNNVATKQRMENWILSPTYISEIRSNFSKENGKYKAVYLYPKGASKSVLQKLTQVTDIVEVYPQNENEYYHFFTYETSNHIEARSFTNEIPKKRLTKVSDYEKMQILTVIGINKESISEMAHDYSKVVRETDVKLVDLNDDGINEYVVVPPFESGFCGASNCSVYILKKENGQYVDIASASNISVDSGEASDVFIDNKNKTSGYKNIISGLHVSAYESHIKTYKYNGMVYIEKECYSLNPQNKSISTCDSDVSENNEISNSFKELAKDLAVGYGCSKAADLLFEKDDEGYKKSFEYVCEKAAE